MKTQELIELAVLDAMGLLDEGEREAFEAGFASASPAVQAQVRREQTRLCQSEALLPDVEPPAGLRALVVEAVRKAMASVGGTGEGLVGGRRHRHSRAGALALIPAKQVSPLWRAASVGFAAAAVTLGATFLHLRGQFNSLAAAVESDRLLSEMQSAVGSSFVVALLTDPATQTREFISMPGVTRGQARLWSNPGWSSERGEGRGEGGVGDGDIVMIAMSNLPANQPEVDEPLRVYAYSGGSITGAPLHEFENTAGFQMVRFSAPGALTGQIAIAQADTSGVYHPVFVTAPAPGLAWVEIDVDLDGDEA